MARAASTDFYQGYRFHVVDPAGGNLDPVAGFTSVTTPNISVEATDYREGVYRWTRKYPGPPTVGDVTLTKGTVKRTSDFYEWIVSIVNGNTDYRSDLVIQEFHITDEFGIDGSPSRIMRLRECFPTDVKPMSDKEASDGAISMQEMTLAVEEFDLEQVAGSGGVNG